MSRPSAEDTDLPIIASPQPRQRPLGRAVGRGDGTSMAAGRSFAGETGDGSEESTVSAEQGES